MEYKIIAIKISNRVKNANEVQQVLTDNGCLIKVRLGLHDVPSDACSAEGLIILEIVSSEQEMNIFVETLNSIIGVDAKSIIL